MRFSSQLKKETCFVLENSAAFEAPGSLPGRINVESKFYILSRVGMLVLFSNSMQVLFNDNLVIFTQFSPSVC